MEERQKALQSSKEKFRKRFPKLTSQHEEICHMDLTNLRMKLRNGQLKAVQVLEAFMTMAIETDR